MKMYLKKEHVAAVLAAALLAGCAVPAAHYYSLSAEPQTHAAPVDERRAPGYGLRLNVSRVPVQVDRPQLVVQDQAGSPAVQVLNNSLWVAPLRDQVQARLAYGVAAVLGVPDLAHLSGLTMLPARRIDVRLDRFDLLWERAAVLNASWTDHRPGASEAPRVCHADMVVPVTAPRVEALVQAQRQALQALALLIAGDGDRTGLPQPAIVRDSSCT